MPRNILVTLVICGTLFVLIGGAFIVQLPYRNAFLPGTVIDGQSVAGLSLAAAQQQLPDTPVNDFTLYLRVDDITVASKSSELGAHRNIPDVLETALTENQKLSAWEKLLRALHVPLDPIEYSTQVSLDEAKTHLFVDALQQKVEVVGEDPQATLGVSGAVSSLKISPGKPGRQVDVAETLATFEKIKLSGNTEVVASVASTSAVLSADEVSSASARASKLVGKKIQLRADNVLTELTDKELVSLLAFPNGLRASQFDALVVKLTTEINRPPQDAVFDFDPITLKVKTFQPSRNGLAANPAQLQRLLSDTLRKLEESKDASTEITVPVSETSPTTSLAKTNTLGINERIGFGESEYEHSIPNRIHNVALTADRVNNYIVKPDEEFSFNKALGDVSAATGFKSAYVIRNGKTELGDGGGVCQVSTTLFRALLNAGLPITKRRPHSYRVSYYELNAKPGIDATVYAGDVDLRFKNDTGHSVLIHTQTNSKTLYMTVELYGTSDGRTAQIVDHKTYDFVPAPAPLYVDDPSLPAGKIQQIDFAASGIKASFKNIVKDKDGNILREDTYFSNYKPWQAVFLRGTGA